MSVLYDEPGPRARRNTIIFSIIFTLLAIGGFYQFMYKPLAAKGQFTMLKWGPLVDPGNEYFDGVWTRIWAGAQVTLTSAAIAIVASTAVGVVLGMVRLQLRSLSHNRYRGLPSAAGYAIRGLTWLLNLITRICIEFFRGIPVIITIFFAWKLLGGTMYPLVVGLTIYNGIVIAEIIRSGMDGLPRGQREAAESIGLSSFQTTWLILLPQAIRVMLPALISQLVVVLKDTALGGLFIAGYEELIAVGKQIKDVLPQLALDQEGYNPLQVFTVIGIMFIIVNYSLSKLAQYAERRLSTKSAGKPVKAAALTDLDTGRAI